MNFYNYLLFNYTLFKRRAFILLGCHLFLIYTPLNAQYPGLHFNILNTTDGLPQNTVNTITKDSAGYVWIGTNNGICRFNGKQIIPFKNYPLEFGKKINKIIASSKNEVVIFNDRGIVLFDYTKNSFSNIYKTSTLNSVVFSGQINGTEIWFFENGKGFGKITSSALFKTDTFFSSRFSAFTITHKYAYFNNKNFIVFKNEQAPACDSMYIYDTDNQSLKTVYICNGAGKKKFLFTFTNNTSGNYYSEDGKDIWAFNITEGTKEKLPAYENLAAPFVFIKTVHQKFTLAGTYGHGLLFGNPAEPGRLIYDNTLTSTLPQNLIDAYLDEQDNVWVGTDGGGLYFFNLPKEPPLVFGKSDKTSEQNIITNVFYENDSVINYQIFDKGWFTYNLLQKKYERILNAPVNETFGDALLYAKKNNKNYFYSDNLLGYFETGKFYYLSKDFSPGGKSSQIHSKALAYASENTLLAACNNQVFSFNKNLPNQLCLFLELQPKGNFINHLGWYKGNLLVASTEGLFLYDSLNKKITSIIQKQNVKHFSLMGDTIFAATEYGIAKLYYENSHGKLIEKRVIQNQFVYGVLPDKAENLWCSTNHGVFKINRNLETLKIYGAGEGIPHEECNTNAFAVFSNYFCAGTLNGAFLVNLNEPITGKKENKIVIEQISVYDKPIKLSNDVAYNYEFKHNENNIRIDFFLNSYTNPKNNMYRYRLEGSDTSWTLWEKESYVRFGYLQAGDYILHIQGKNSLGQISQTANIIFKIKPPLYLNWWFILSEVVTGCLLIALFVYLYFRTKLLRQKREEAEKHRIQSERERISRDLHDNIGSQISYILNNLEWIQQNQNIGTDKRLNIIDSVNSAGRDLMQSIRETIWALKKESLTIEDFAFRLQSSLKKYNESPLIKVWVKQEIKLNNQLSAVESLNILRIVQEAVNNAFKYAMATEIIITVGADENTSYSIETRDNGKGMDMNRVMEDDHYGLDNMKYRAEEVGAKFEMNSALGKGTVVKIYKLLYM